MVFVQLINVVCNQNATQCSSSQLVVVTYSWCNRARINSIPFIYQKRIELLQFVKYNFIIISLFEFNFSFDAIVKKLLLVYIHIICHMDFALGIKLSKNIWIVTQKHASTCGLISFFDHSTSCNRKIKLLVCVRYLISSSELSYDNSFAVNTGLLIN